MTNSEPLATHQHSAGQVPESLAFLKRTRDELRSLRMVRIWTDRLQVFDINGDFFEVQGIGYQDEEIIALLESINTAFKRESIHRPTSSDYKEFKTGRRYPWAQDRVM